MDEQCRDECTKRIACIVCGRKLCHAHEVGFSTLNGLVKEVEGHYLLPNGTVCLNCISTYRGHL